MNRAVLLVNVDFSCYNILVEGLVQALGTSDDVPELDLLKGVKEPLRI